MNDPLHVLLEAIKTAWVANRNASGGLQIFADAHFFEKPADAVKKYPYAVIEPDADSEKILQTNKTSLWRHLIVFSLYDRTDTLLGQHAGVIHTVFGAGYFDLSQSPLVLSQGSLHSVQPGSTMKTRLDKSVWRADVRYQIETQVPRS